MVLRYLHKLNPDDETAEVIMESDTLAPMVSCIEHFWDNLGKKISYFRYIDYAEKGICIDFGSYYSFYQVIGYAGTFHEFAKEFEAARKLRPE